MCNTVLFDISLSLPLSLHIGQHRGIPNQLADQNNRAGSSLIPDVDSAVAMYEASGGYLSTPSGFGTDPIAGSPELLYYRQSLMEQNIPSPEDLFGWTVNGSTQPFADSLKYMNSSAMFHIDNLFFFSLLIVQYSIMYNNNNIPAKSTTLAPI